MTTGVPFDLPITVSNYAVAEHPILPLFSDEDAVICWNRGRFATGITADQFLEASHAVALFGEERRPTVAEQHFEAAGIVRRAGVNVPGSSALPGAVVGTDRVAPMHRRHAELFAKLYPIEVHAPPIAGPDVREVVQWHRLREKDSGGRWLLALLLDEAAALPGPSGSGNQPPASCLIPAFDGADRM